MGLPGLNEWESTQSVDPWTDNGYSDWRDNALEVRRAWMTMMGLSNDEIEKECRPGNKADFDEELGQYNAMVDIDAINDRSDGLCR